jgi:hypothetical protein
MRTMSMLAEARDKVFCPKLPCILRMVPAI